MAKIAFHNARDLQDACDTLAQYGEKAKILAGGTDIMVKLNRRLVAPEMLVHIGGCELNYVKLEEKKIVIGATTPLAYITRSKPLQERIPLLVEAVRHMGGVAIRNAATIGGNLSNASPAADSSVPLLALGASLRLTSKRSERTIPIEGFFVGPGQTVLNPDELLKEVIIPIPESDTKWAYHKIGRRRAETLSVVAGAISARLIRDKCSKAMVALCAVAPTPILVKKAADLLEGRQLDTDLIESVAEAAVEETSPVDDVRATAWYRRRATKALVKGLLEELAK